MLHDIGIDALVAASANLNMTIKPEFSIKAEPNTVVECTLHESAVDVARMMAHMNTERLLRQIVHEEMRNKDFNDLVLDGYTIGGIDMANHSSLSIKQYTYKCPVTTIEWTDGTRTKVSCNPDNADQFTGFVIAIAKKAMGNDNTMVNTYDKFIKEFKKKQEAEAQAKKIAEESAQREATLRKKREKKARRRRVERLAKEYAVEYEAMTTDDPSIIEARKLAVEKYGVPEDFF